jgi:hypothetical protein
MRYGILGTALVMAAAAGAQAQASTWGAFEADGGFGVGVQGEDGAQLMLKCDKPGAGEVYAVVAVQTGLVPPSQDFEMGPVFGTTDTKPPFDDRWRYYERSVIAINKGTERSLTRFLTNISDAKRLELRLEPNRRTRVAARFNVTGAKDAIAQVYASCKDQVPTA